MSTYVNVNNTTTLGCTQGAPRVGLRLPWLTRIATRVNVNNTTTFGLT